MVSNKSEMVNNDRIELVNGKWVFYCNKERPEESPVFATWLMHIPNNYKIFYPVSSTYPYESEFDKQGCLKHYASYNDSSPYLNEQYYWDARMLAPDESLRVFKFDRYLSIKIEHY